MIWPGRGAMFPVNATVDGLTYVMMTSPEALDKFVGIDKLITVAPGPPSVQAIIKEIHIYEDRVDLTVIPYRPIGEKIREAEEMSEHDYIMRRGERFRE